MALRSLWKIAVFYGSDDESYKKKNAVTVTADVIFTETGQVTVRAIRTDEELMIATLVYRVLGPLAAKRRNE